MMVLREEEVGNGIRPSFLSSIYMMEMNATEPAVDNCEDLNDAIIFLIHSKLQNPHE